MKEKFQKEIERLLELMTNSTDATKLRDYAIVIDFLAAALSKIS